MRFQVPQFIEIEDKIFGPFTWKQFIYLVGGGGVAVVLFLISPRFGFVVAGLPVLGLALLLGFYPVNNRPFAIYLESMLRYVFGAKLYLWRKQSDFVYKKAPTAMETSIDVAGAPEAKKTHLAPTMTKKNLSNVSRSLELSSIDKPEEV